MNIYKYEYKIKSPIGTRVIKKETLRNGKLKKIQGRRNSILPTIQKDCLSSNSSITSHGNTKGENANKPAIEKQNLVFENSNFVYESSFDSLNQIKSNSPVKRIEKKHESLLSKVVSKGVPAKDKNIINGIVNLKEDHEEINTFYQNSTYFYNFNNPETEKQFSDYIKPMFEKHFEKSLVINLCFLVTMSIGLYELCDLLEYRNYDSQIYSLNILKISSYIIFVFIINLFHSVKKREKLFKGLLGGVYLLISIVIQIQINFLPKNFIINLVIEQNYVILCSSYNG